MNYSELIRNGLAKLDELLNKAHTEERDLTEEEQTVFDELEAKIKEWKNALEREKRIAAIREDLALPASEPSPKNVKLGANREEKKPWDDYGEFLMAVKDAGDPARQSYDARLMGKISNLGTGMQVGVGTDGGFMVGEQFATRMMESVVQRSTVFEKISMIPVGEGKNRVVLPRLKESSRADGSRAGGVRAYWANEGATATASKPQIDELNLKLEKLLAFAYMTEELMTDGVAMAAFVEREYGKEMAFKVDDGIFNGTGVGVPLGILSSAPLISVAKETGQSAATVVFENIVKMWARLIPSAQTRAAWFINQEVQPELMTMAMVVGTGGVPVYMPAGGVSTSPYGTLMGRPVIPVEHLPALGTAGDILLADMADYIGIDKRGVQTDTSIHVQFLYDESVFRFRYRFNGAPYTYSALTPYKGTATISPYVTVATRS